jgi:sugar lactone lactonase YvrE
MRLQALNPSQQGLVRATVEVEGVLAESALEMEGVTRARGRYAIEVAEETTRPLKLRVYGRHAADRPEVLLARLTQDVRLKPHQENRPTLNQPFVTSGGVVFDVNRNGVSNLEDLLRGIDPTPPPALVDVSPTTLQFPSGIRPGRFGRQAVILENTSASTVRVRATVYGAPGVAVSVVDEVGGSLDSQPPVRALEVGTLSPFSERLLLVTFAPTNTYLTTGVVRLEVEEVSSQVVQAFQVKVIGNADGTLQPAPPRYAPADVAPGANLAGYTGSVRSFPAAALFNGLAVDADAAEGAVLPPLTYTGQTLLGRPADQVYLVEVPARHRFSATLTGLDADVDLGVFLLDDADNVVAAEGSWWWSGVGGRDAEALAVRWDADTPHRVLVVLGRVDTREGATAAVPGGLAAEELPAHGQLALHANAGPELTSLEPDSGPFLGGTTVTLRGSGFQRGATVTLDDSVCGQAVVADDGTSIACTLPPGRFEFLGRRSTVVVSNPAPSLDGDGQYATLPDGFAYLPPPPRIDALFPSTGSTDGNTPVTVKGAFFTTVGGMAPEVFFGPAGDEDVHLTADLRALSVTFVSAAELRVTAPPHAAGPVNVLVRNPPQGGVSTRGLAANAFLYVTPTGPAPVPLSLAPTSGDAGGGTTVTVTGQDLAPGSSVLFGGRQALSVQEGPGGSLVAVTPEGEPGTVDVAVVTPDGQVGRLVSAFTYVVPSPRVDRVTPGSASVWGGTQVALEGAGFRPDVTVALVRDSSVIPASSVTRLSSARLFFVSPAVSQAGRYLVRVTNAGAPPTDHDGLQVVEPAGPPPRVTRLTPATVSVSGGEVVTVQGEGFADPAVLVGGVAAQVTGWQSTGLTFVAPAADGPTSAVVRVVNADGQSDASVLHYVGATSPVVVAVVPSVIHAAVPGDVLTVLGRDLDVIALQGVSLILTGQQQEVSCEVVTAEETRVVVRVAGAVGAGGAVSGELRLLYGSRAPVVTPRLDVVTARALDLRALPAQPSADQPFSVLVLGAWLNPSHLTSLALVKPDTPRTLPVSSASETHVAVDVATGELAKGSYVVSLVYDNGHQVEAPGVLVVHGRCGDGQVDPGEACEPMLPLPLGCSDLGFLEGVAACGQHCQWDTSRCVGPVNTCGNGVREGPEQCDRHDVNGLTCTALGFRLGTLSCAENCTFLTADCEGPPASCGNNIPEGLEECDGSVPPDLSCMDLGLLPGTGPVTCGPGCRVDLSACGMPARQCGNQVREQGEECDGDDVGGLSCVALGRGDGTLRCNTMLCRLDVTGCGPVVAQCGDGVRGGDEECDGGDLAGHSCRTLGFTDGSLTCNGCKLVTAGCTGRTSSCGNDVREAGEDCDGNDLGGRNCAAVGRLPGTTGLACHPATCTYDLTGCGPLKDFCGNGVREAFEQCDDLDTGGATCKSFGFSGGMLGCTNLCAVDTGACTGAPTLCGNGTLDPLEECDGSDLNGQTCITRGRFGGNLSCHDCRFDESACGPPSWCGNDRVEMGEQCDGTDLAGQTCLTRGHGPGFLDCLSCMFDTTLCGPPLPVCGNNIKELGEQCDGDDRPTCGFLGFQGGDTWCDNQCVLRKESCTLGCGNNVVEADEACDGHNMAGKTCGLVPGFTGGELRCMDCSLDTSGCYTCGDGVCGNNENNTVCWQDCPAGCGNGQCDAGESCLTCAKDCACSIPFGMAVHSALPGDLVLRAIPTSLVIKVTDDLGRAVGGVPLRFTPPPGGTADPLEVKTDANGLASTLVRLGRKSGPQTILVDAQEVPGVTFTTNQISTMVTAGDLFNNQLVTLANTSGMSGKQAAPGDVPAVTSPLDLDGSGVAVAGDGTVYVSDTVNHRVVAVTPEGWLRVVAGTGMAGWTGDGGPAVEAQLDAPRGLALDGTGNLYVADGAQNVVRRISLVDGKIYRFAGGNGPFPGNGDGGLAGSASLSNPSTLLMNRTRDKMYILDQGNGAVRQVEMAGTMVSTVATESAQACDPDGNPLPWRFLGGMAVDGMDNLFLASEVTSGAGCPLTSGHHVLRRTLTGYAAVAGGSTQRERGAALGTMLNLASGGLAFDVTGNLYVADGFVSRIFRVDRLGLLSPVVGSGQPGHDGDHGTAEAARVTVPAAMVFGEGGHLYFLDGAKHALRMVAGLGNVMGDTCGVTVLSGNSQQRKVGQSLGAVTLEVKRGGAPAPNVMVRLVAQDGGWVTPGTALTDANGRLEVFPVLGMTPGMHHYVAQVVALDGSSACWGTVDAVAGDALAGDMVTVVNRAGLPGSSNLPAPGGLAPLNLAAESGLAAHLGTRFIADTYNHRVVKVDGPGNVTLVAGRTSSAGFSGDGFAAVGAQLDQPAGLALHDDNGQVTLYVADRQNHRVRRIVEGVISTYAGGAPDGPGHGDLGPATGANLSFPSHLAVANNGDLYITDFGRSRVRMVERATLEIDTVVVAAQTCSGTTGVQPHVLRGPLAVDGLGRLYLAASVFDAGGCPVPSQDYVLRREVDGSYTALVGGTETRTAGPALGTRLTSISGLATDQAGNLFVAEGAGGHRIRRIDHLGRLTTVSGRADGVSGTPTDHQAADGQPLDGPGAMALGGARDLWFLNLGSHSVKYVRDVGRETLVLGSLMAVGGGDQVAQVCSPLPAALEVKVEEAGAGVEGVRVDFWPPPGAWVSALSAVTDAAGVARVSAWTPWLDNFLSIGYAALTPLESIPIPGAASFAFTAEPQPVDSVLTVVNVTRQIDKRIDISGTHQPLDLRAGAGLGGMALWGDAGDLYVSVPWHNRVIRVDQQGAVQVVAGTGEPGFSGDNGLAENARLYEPTGLALHNDYLYIADTQNNRVRRVGPDGMIETWAGGGAGNCALNGDGGDRRLATLTLPTSVAVDSQGALYVQEAGCTGVVRKVAADLISTVVSYGMCTAVSGLQVTNLLGGMTINSSDNLVLTAEVFDAGGCAVPSGFYVVEVTGPGIMSALAGGTGPDTGITEALGTSLNGPRGIVETPQGYVVTLADHRLRRFMSNGNIEDLGGMQSVFGFSLSSSLSVSRFDGPTHVSVDGSGRLAVTDKGNQAIRVVRLTPP